jgi:hypothetical protein
MVVKQNIVIQPDNRIHPGGRTRKLATSVEDVEEKNPKTLGRG